MPPSSNPISAMVHECVNIERCKAEFAQAVADARIDGAQAVAEIGAQVGKLRESVAVLASQTEDLRLAISALPRDVAEIVERERTERAARMARGEGHFDRLFERLGRVEKQVIVLWVLIGVIGVGKLAAFLFPMVGTLLP